MHLRKKLLVEELTGTKEIYHISVQSSVQFQSTVAGPGKVSTHLVPRLHGRHMLVCDGTGRQMVELQFVHRVLPLAFGRVLLQVVVLSERLGKLLLPKERQDRYKLSSFWASM